MERVIRSAMLTLCVACCLAFIALWTTSYRTPLVVGGTRFPPGFERQHFGIQSIDGRLSAWDFRDILIESDRAVIAMPSNKRPPRLDYYFPGEVPPGRPETLPLGLSTHDVTLAKEKDENGRVYRHISWALTLPHAIIVFVTGMFPAIAVARRIRRRGLWSAASSLAFDLITGVIALLVIVFASGVIASALRGGVGFASVVIEPITGPAGKLSTYQRRVEIGFDGGYFGCGWDIVRTYVDELPDRAAYVTAGFDLSSIAMDGTRGSSLAGVRGRRGGYVDPKGMPMRWVAFAVPWYISIPTLLLLLTPFWLLPSIRARRAARMRATGLCTSCGYDLRANTSGVCPECGTAIADAAGKPILPRASTTSPAAKEISE